MQNEVFYQKHIKCLENIIKILQKKLEKGVIYPNIKLEIFLSYSNSTKNIKLKYSNVFTFKEANLNLNLLNIFLSRAKENVYKI